MVKAAAANGWIDERRSVLETLTSIRRAGRRHDLDLPREGRRRLARVRARLGPEARARRARYHPRHDPIRGAVRACTPGDPGRVSIRRCGRSGGVGGTPLFFDRGEGAYLIDVDGNRYVDLVQSWGALLFGHARPEIVEAATARGREGAPRSALPSKAEVELAQRIVDAVPGVEQVRLVNSGTEAAMSAIRLARGATGRDLVVKFEGCYHGHSDSLLAKGAGSGLATLGIPSSPGVTEGSAKDTLTAPFNDLEAVRAIFAERGGEVAVVAVEPVAANMGVVPPAPGFLEGLRELCTEHGRAAAVRRGDHRVPDRLRRRAVLLRRDARPHGAREGDGRRVPVRGVRRARDAHGAAGAHRPGLPGGHAEREPGGGGGRDRRARPGPHHRSVSRSWKRRPTSSPTGSRSGVRGDRDPRDDQPRRLDVQRVLRRWADPELLGCERRPITSDMPGCSTIC